ncbi:MAG: transposase [Bacteroidales bacterium]|nr:transposase [Bacteroidales bacterium]
MVITIFEKIFFCMQHIAQANRHQVDFSSLDCRISANNPVRFIDAFVDKLDLPRLQFEVTNINTEGVHRSIESCFSKYTYTVTSTAYAHRVSLRRECMRNVEMQWLCGNLVPNYHSIADFRKDNSQALRNTVKLFVQFLSDCDLLGKGINSH